MHLLYVGLGTNIGNKEKNLNRALLLLADKVGKVTRVSSFMETVPQGFLSENLFLNAVASIETDLTPRQCLETTRDIELQMGRTQKSVNGQYQDRVIDIDLLLYDDWKIQDPDLVIPHPRMLERDFVLLPLKEIGWEM